MVLSGLMNLEEINVLAEQDIAAVNENILLYLKSDIPLINQVGRYTINSGGKRIRPLIAVLSARALGYTGDKHLSVAALVEFIHNATLLHDDVVDQSTLRRGQATSSAAFGDAASVLVGDFIFTRAFQMMVELGSWPVIALMSDTVNVMAEGEVLQLMNCRNLDVTEENYMQMIYSKTARLFEAAAQAAAIISDAPAEHEQALQTYGRHMGTAFQLIDDLLDYSTDDKTLGKHIGDDLREGKLTLPLLHAMQQGTPEQTQMIRTAIEHQQGEELLMPILEIMHQYGSLIWTHNYAQRETEEAIGALKMLPETPWREALESLARLSVQRTF